jgi:putative FmdB family regulatory protein
MPTYEYKCKSCGKVKEVVHKISEDINLSCHDCLIKMNKGFGGGVGVHFKGSGFYETDYKNK